MWRSPCQITNDTQCSNPMCFNLQYTKPTKGLPTLNFYWQQAHARDCYKRMQRWTAYVTDVFQAGARYPAKFVTLINMYIPAKVVATTTNAKSVIQKLTRPLFGAHLSVHSAVLFVMKMACLQAVPRSPT